jgi:L-rhamnose mutarotase
MPGGALSQNGGPQPKKMRMASDVKDNAITQAVSTLIGFSPLPGIPLSVSALLTQHQHQQHQLAQMQNHSLMLQQSSTLAGQIPALPLPTQTGPCPSQLPQAIHATKPGKPFSAFGLPPGTMLRTVFEEFVDNGQCANGRDPKAVGGGQGLAKEDQQASMVMVKPWDDLCEFMQDQFTENGAEIPTLFTNQSSRKRSSICFEMTFDVAELEHCIDAHKSVWPEMQQALVQCGWHNYSLFCRADGLAIGYYETEHVSHQAALEAMRKTEVNARWQETMKRFMATKGRPDETQTLLGNLGTSSCQSAGPTANEKTLARNVAALAARKADWKPQQFTGGGVNHGGMRRICFEMRFDATDLEGCLKAHKSIWPEMQQALVQCGWHNYSLFYRADGLAIGYYETEHVSHQAALEAMRKTEVNARWQETMKRFMSTKGQPAETMKSPYTQIFYLGSDEQEASLALCGLRRRQEQKQKAHQACGAGAGAGSLQVLQK